MQQDLHEIGSRGHAIFAGLANTCLGILPLIVLATGLLMVSHFRYPHVVNRYLRGRRSIDRLLLVLIGILLLIVWHQYTMAIGALIYSFLGPVSYLYTRLRHRLHQPPPTPA